MGGTRGSGGSGPALAVDEISPTATPQVAARHRIVPRLIGRGMPSSSTGRTTFARGGPACYLTPMKLAMSPMEKVRAAGKFLDVKLNKRPLTVSLEVTKRCNARCDFCDYWKISDRDEMTDFTDVIRRFDPLVVVFTGGEPMLRRDLTPIVRSIREVPGFRYITLLTHGGFLNEKKIEEL